MICSCTAYFIPGQEPIKKIEYFPDSRVRRHLQFANQIDNPTDPHRLHRGERNRVFARCCEKPGFFDKSKLGSKYCGKNPVSDLCAGGERNLLICARGLS
jgi:hypothetical protein